jgi:hypothetical protein
MQLLKVARSRPGAASSSQPDKKGEFSSGFVDTSPCLLTIPLISFATSSARYPVGSGGDAGTLEIDPERSVEGKLKGSFLYLTHWVLISGAPGLRLHPHKH